MKPNDNQPTPVRVQPVVGQRATMSCGCPDATIPTTRDFVSMCDEDWPDTYQGYTCKCGKCFFPTPALPNGKISD